MTRIILGFANCTNINNFHWKMIFLKRVWLVLRRRSWNPILSRIFSVPRVFIVFDKKFPLQWQNLLDSALNSLLLIFRGKWFTAIVFNTSIVNTFTSKKTWICLLFSLLPLFFYFFIVSWLGNLVKIIQETPANSLEEFVPRSEEKCFLTSMSFLDFPGFSEGFSVPV